MTRTEATEAEAIKKPRAESVAEGEKRKTDECTLPLRNKYSLRGFMRYLQGNPWDVAASIFFLLLGYELKMFGDSYSIDTEAMMQAQGSLYQSWIELERFGLLYLKKALGLYWYNNAVASFLSAVCLLAASLLWAYLLAEVNNLRGRMHPAFFAVPFVTSPVLAEMVGFTLTGPEIGMALGLVATSLMMLLNCMAYRKWWLGILSLFVAAAGFTLYLAMVTVFVAGFAMVFLMLFWDAHHEYKLGRRIGFIAVGAVAFVISYLLYVACNAAALAMHHTTTNSYISEQSRWGKDSTSSIIQTIRDHAQSLYSGEGIYYAGIFSVLLVLFVATMLVAVIRRHTDVLALLVALCLCASPMMMSLILGSKPSARTELSYPLMLAFVVAFLAVQVFGMFDRKRTVKTVAALLVLALGWSQGLIVNRIFYTESINHQQDMELAQDIRTRIDDLGITDQSKKTLVFLNYHMSACNKDCYTSDQLGLVGRSLFEVTVSSEQGTFVKTNFLNITGTNFQQASEKQLDRAEKIGESMPHWPARGSVIQKGDLVIVKF